MLERFVARVGTIGAILILALAVLLVGFGGGVVEHFRLAAAQSEQQGDQSGTQGESQQAESGTQGESKQGEQGKTGSQQEDQAGTQGQSQEGESASASKTK
jgi:hypothetical protein